MIIEVILNNDNNNSNNKIIEKIEARAKYNILNKLSDNSWNIAPYKLYCTIHSHCIYYFCTFCTAM